MAETQNGGAEVTLYWLNKSRSQRIFWMLEEANAPYKVEIFKRLESKLAPPELKKIHPLGKSPLISVNAPGLEKPIVIAESGNITHYLAEHFAPRLIPTRYPAGKEGQVGMETEGYLRYQFYLQYAEGSLMSLLLTAYLFGTLVGPEVPFFIRPITRAIKGKVDDLYFNPNFKSNFEFLESQLATSPDDGEFLCGKDLTAVDILMSFPLLAAREGKLFPLASYPKLDAYIRRLEAQEGYLRSIKKAEELTGEKYSIF